MSLKDQERKLDEEFAKLDVKPYVYHLYYSPKLLQTELIRAIRQNVDGIAELNVEVLEAENE